MISAGVPIHRALQLYSKDSGPLTPIATKLADSVARGLRLSQALLFYPETFSPVFVGQVESAEMTGQMEQCWDRLARLMERQFIQQKRIQAAMTYPLVLLVCSCLVVLGLMYFIVPAIVPVFTNLGVALPWPTRLLLTMRYVLGPGFVGLVLGGTLLYWRRRPLALWIRSHPDFERALAEIPLRIPGIGTVLVKVVTARVTHAMAVLLDNGLTLTVALQRCAAITGNAHISHRLLGAKKAIESGASFSTAIFQFEVFPRAAVHLIAAGAESSNLAATLYRVAEFYDDEVNFALDVATNMMEPLIMAGMGIVIGFIAVASVLPTLQLLSRF